MAPETKTHIACACPPSHRRLRRVLSAIAGLLVAGIAAALIYIGVTGGATP